jgi:hypothetical protein
MVMIQTTTRLNERFILGIKDFDRKTNRKTVVCVEMGFIIRKFYAVSNNLKILNKLRKVRKMFYKRNIHH